MTASAGSTASGAADSDAAALGDAASEAAALGLAAPVEAWVVGPGVNGDGEAVDPQPTTSNAVAMPIESVRFRCTGVLLLVSIPVLMGGRACDPSPRPASRAGPSTHGFACDHLLRDRIQQGDRAPCPDVVICRG